MQNQIKNFLIKMAVIAGLLLAAGPVTAAGADLGLKELGIESAPADNVFFAGEQVRVYALAYNYGSRDAIGQIVLKQGTSIIGYEPVELEAESKAQKVYFDLTVPQADFNLYAELVNVEPADKKFSNNTILSRMYYVRPAGEIDEPTPVAVNEPVPPEQSKVQTTALPVAPRPAITPSLTLTKQTQAAEPAVPETEIVESVYQSPEIQLLNKVEIVVEQVGWNSFNFSFTTNVPSLDQEKLDYVWDFGNGREMRQNGGYTFWTSGEHYVTLRVRGPFANDLYDSAQVQVRFWSWNNYWLWFVLLAVLFFLLGWLKHWENKQTKTTESEPLRQPKKRVYFGEQAQNDHEK